MERHWTLRICKTRTFEFSLPLPLFWVYAIAIRIHSGMLIDRRSMRCTSCHQYRLPDGSNLNTSVCRAKEAADLELRLCGDIFDSRNLVTKVVISMRSQRDKPSNCVWAVCKTGWHQENRSFRIIRGITRPCIFRL